MELTRVTAAEDGEADRSQVTCVSLKEDAANVSVVVAVSWPAVLS